MYITAKAGTKNHSNSSAITNLYSQKFVDGWVRRGNVVSETVLKAHASISAKLRLGNDRKGFLAALFSRDSHQKDNGINVNRGFIRIYRYLKIINLGH